MGRLIDADELLSIVRSMTVVDKSVMHRILIQMPTVDAVPVRCIDCKHRPTGTNRDDLEFPDDKCPCQCEDFWYSWKPSDDWFCGNGERKDGDNG